MGCVVFILYGIYKCGRSVITAKPGIITGTATVSVNNSNLPGRFAGLRAWHRFLLFSTLSPQRLGRSNVHYTFDRWDQFIFKTYGMWIGRNLWIPVIGCIVPVGPVTASIPVPPQDREIPTAPGFTQISRRKSDGRNIPHNGIVSIRTQPFVGNNRCLLQVFLAEVAIYSQVLFCQCGGSFIRCLFCGAVFFSVRSIYSGVLL